jgi:WD40 repeat protein
LLASAGGKRAVRLWDVATGKELRTLEGVAGGVLSVEFSPDGKTLAVATWSETELWDVDSGQRRFTLTQRKYPVDTFAFSPDGETLASGSGPVVTLWDVASGKELRRFIAHERSATGSPFGTRAPPDERRLRSARAGARIGG